MVLNSQKMNISFHNIIWKNIRKCFAFEFIFSYHVLHFLHFIMIFGLIYCIYLKRETAEKAEPWSWQEQSSCNHSLVYFCQPAAMPEDLTF